ncbi:hypothetical protein ZWY2020_040163 [Hordeum vulgare]|nr:hypothetical protein ZWY2020_040163 [Hordeum vulgare]
MGHHIAAHHAHFPPPATMLPPTAPPPSMLRCTTPASSSSRSAGAIPPPPPPSLFASPRFLLLPSDRRRPEIHLVCLVFCTRALHRRLPMPPTLATAASWSLDEPLPLDPATTTMTRPPPPDPAATTTAGIPPLLRTRARVVLAGNIDLLTRATSNFPEEGFIHGVAVLAPPSPARRTAHVMSFKPGAVLEDAAEWQAPNYCFAAGNDDLAL